MPNPTCNTIKIAAIASKVLMLDWKTFSNQANSSSKTITAAIGTIISTDMIQKAKFLPQVYKTLPTDL